MFVTKGKSTSSLLLRLSIIYGLNRLECVFRYRRSNVRQLFPASGYCRACGDEIVEQSSENETVLVRSRKPGEAAEHLIDGSGKRIGWLSFEF